MDLTGKVAIVTGSGRGIGRAYAEALVAAGASVVINDVDAEVAAETVRELSAAGGRVVAEVCAVGSTESAARLVQRAIDEFGRLDIMVTNAGILRDGVLWKMTDDAFDKVIETHLRGTFTCARAAAVQMRAQGQGGRIVLIGSEAGQRGNFGQGNYAAAKAGIAAAARTWSMELARDHITVNAIIPNALTRMIASIPGMGDAVAAAERGEPLPDVVRKAMGMGLAAEVAPLLVFLCSNEAQAVSGQCVGIGGDKIALWSHPEEVAAAYTEGGWTAEKIAAVWGTTIGRRLEPVGIPWLTPKPGAGVTRPAIPTADTAATTPLPPGEEGLN